MGEANRILYICEICFHSQTEPGECHDHPLIRCDAGCPGDECTQPVGAADGRLLTRAPRWWIYRHGKLGRTIKPHE
jgi:hypothetical protein